MTIADRSKPSIADVMYAITSRREGQRPYAMKLEHICEALNAPQEDNGLVYEAALGAQELGLVTGVGDPDSWHMEAIPTAKGLAWTPDMKLPDITFMYLIEGEKTLGTITDYAKAFEHNQYGGDLALSEEVRTWTETFPARVARTGQSATHLIYEIWIAGQTATVLINSDV